MIIAFNKEKRMSTACCPIHRFTMCDGPACAWFQMLEREPMQPDDEIRGKCAMSYLEDIAYQLKKIKEEALDHE